MKPILIKLNNISDRHVVYVISGNKLKVIWTPLQRGNRGYNA